jgi:squalene/oxidosqualene cyclase-like protein
VYRELQCLPNFKDYTNSELDALVKRVQKEQGLAADDHSTGALRGLLKGMNYYQNLQMEDGHWPGDYGGPMFLMPGALITLYVSGCMDELLTPQHKLEMIRYLWNHQSPDGGWGIHIEEPCTMFGTVLTYVSLRLLGVPANEPKLKAAKEFIHANGGAMKTPSWGKFWLCVLGVYEWEGVNSLFPELWAFPEWLPVHPWRWWCHCRMVYLPMAYAYGHRVTGKLTPLVLALRQELYPMPYSEIDFSKHRDAIAAAELYTPQTPVLKLLNLVTNAYEKVHSGWFRKRALDFILSYIHAEDSQTKYVDIGPVNKFINMLAVWHACGPKSKQFEAHKSRVGDYLWLAEDGIKCQGYNGSQLWDTAFALQAYVESGLAPYFASTLKKGYSYVEISQVLEDVEDRVKFYRHISKGGWPFSTRDHGWPISDCTAEGLKAALALHDEVIEPKERTITAERCFDAINVILSFQNTDGGWATYENTRTGAWIEAINPAEVFGGIMIDYSYVECTSASIQAMVDFRKKHRFPDHRKAEIEKSIARGAQFIKNKQRPDGSWYGSWAVCFTYGAWFGIEGLISAGESENSVSIQKGVKFLLDRQNADGGWGESYKACVTKQWVPKNEGSQVVNTAWAALALMKAGVHKTNPEPIENAIRFLLGRQQPNGEWEQEGISGVFNGNCE